MFVFIPSFTSILAGKSSSKLFFSVVKEFLKVVFSLKHGIVMSLSAKIIAVNRLHCTS